MDVQTVTVTGVDDTVDNAAARSVTINHSPTGGGYGTEEAGKVTVNVADEGQTQTPHAETRGLVYSSDEPVVIEGQQATYTVKLMSKPTSAVTLELNRTACEPSPCNTTDHIRIDPQFLTFTTATWNTPQTVRLIGSSDEVDNEPNDAAFTDISRKTTITHQPSGGGYAGLATGLTVTVGLRDDDTAGLALSTKALTLVDEGNTATYTVALRSEPPGTDTVTVTVSGATGAVASVDTDKGTTGNQDTLTFTAANWRVGQTVTVTAEDDDIDQPGTNRVVPIANTTSGTARYAGLNEIVENVDVTVNDNDVAGVVISESRLTIVEGVTADYTVVLTSEPTTGVTVNVTSTDTSTATVQNVSFSATDWNEAKTVTVTAVDDTIDNAGGRRLATIEHTFTGGGYERVAQKNVAVTVTDNDGTAGIVISRSSASLRESASQGLKYTVRLRQDPGTSVNVSVAVSGDAVQVATEGGSPSSSASLSFDSTDYTQRQTITITPVDDEVDNGGNRSARISHTASDIIGANIAVTVIDDDIARLLVAPVGAEAVTEGGTVQYEVKLNSAPAASVNVRVVSTDPAIATVPDTLTDTGLAFTSGTDVHTITVTAASDDVDNPGASRTVDITFTPSGDGDYGPALAKTERVTVRDDDTAALDIAPTELSINENGGTQSYVVKLATEPTGTVNVAVSSSSVKAATVDKSMLRFRPSDWSTSQTVLVTGVLDSARGDRTATITNIPSGGGYGSSQTGRVRVTVQEDTSPGLRITPRELTVAEGATATYTVELNSEPQGDVTVAITSGSPAATVSPASLTFTTTNWDLPRDVTVTGTDDKVVTGDQKVTINNSSDGGAHNYDYTATVDVTVMEDDATLALSLPAVVVPETGTGTYTVKLDGRPNGAVTIKLESVDPGVATVTPAELTFTPTNYATVQTVTVSGVNDRVDNSGGSRSTSVRHTPSGGGYDSTVPISVSVTVTDDEGLRFVPAAVTVGEAGGRASYTLQLTAEPTGNVTVALESSNTDVARVSPASVVFTSGNWATPQSVTVTGVDDDVDNPGDARSATISHRPSGSGYLIVETVEVTVTDDDAAPSGIALTTNVQSVNEGDAARQITVTAAPVGTRFGTARTFIVQVGAGGDSATEGTDYVAVADFPLTIPAGAENATASFTLTPLDDPVFEGDEIITVTIELPGLTVAEVALVLFDNDAAPILSISGSDVLERADGPTSDLVFTVTKSGPTSAVETTVQYADNVSGSADSGMDYAPLPAGTLTFAADETAKSITVTVWDDDTYEVDETIYVELSNPTNGELATAMAAGTIVNDDPAPEFSISGGRIAEGDAGTNSVLLFSVTKSGATAEVATVGYADALSGTATSGSDYAAVPPGTLTFAAGQSAQEIRVIVQGDATYELDETIDLSLNNATHATIAVGTGSGTIVDDDTQPVLSISETSVTEGEDGTMAELVFTVTRSGAETEVPTTVEYVDAGTGTAESGTDYVAVMAGMLTFAPDVTSQTITVMVYGDAIYEEDETVDIRLSNPDHATLVTETASGTILNDDAQPVLSISGMSIAEGEDGTMAELVFTVTKTGSVSQVATTVDYADALSGTAESGTDYEALVPGTLTFAADETEKTISVMVLGDAIYEEDETVDIMLSNPTHGTIETETASGIIANDDAAPELSIVGSSVAEGEDGTMAELVFTVTKTGSVSQVATTVDFSDAGSGTATSGTDYEAVAAGTLTFAADETEKTITVTVLGDTVYEADETVDIVLDNVVHGTIATGTASGTIVNDEAAPALAISGTSVVEGDAGSTVELVFTVTKAGLPERGADHGRLRRCRHRHRGVRCRLRGDRAGYTDLRARREREDHQRRGAGRRRVRGRRDRPRGVGQRGPRRDRGGRGSRHHRQRRRGADARDPRVDRRRGRRGHYHRAGVHGDQERTHRAGGDRLLPGHRQGHGRVRYRLPGGPARHADLRGQRDRADHPRGGAGRQRVRGKRDGRDRAAQPEQRDHCRGQGQGDRHDHGRRPAAAGGEGLDGALRPRGRERHPGRDRPAHERCGGGRRLVADDGRAADVAGTGAGSGAGRTGGGALGGERGNRADPRGAGQRHRLRPGAQFRRGLHKRVGCRRLQPVRDDAAWHLHDGRRPDVRHPRCRPRGRQPRGGNGPGIPRRVGNLQRPGLRLGGRRHRQQPVQPAPLRAGDRGRHVPRRGQPRLRYRRPAHRADRWRDRGARYGHAGHGGRRRAGRPEPDRGLGPGDPGRRQRRADGVRGNGRDARGGGRELPPAPGAGKLLRLPVGRGHEPGAGAGDRGALRRRRCRDRGRSRPRRCGALRRRGGRPDGRGARPGVPGQPAG